MNINVNSLETDVLLSAKFVRDHSETAVPLGQSTRRHVTRRMLFWYLNY